MVGVEIPGGPTARALMVGPGSIPGQGTKILHAAYTQQQ